LDQDWLFLEWFVELKSLASSHSIPIGIVYYSILNLASLLFVMLVAVGLNFITFRLVNKPLLNDAFEAPKLSVIDLKLVLGSSLFGVGWGIGGLCPGPAIALFPEFTIEIGVVFLLALAIGQVVAQQVS